MLLWNLLHLEIYGILTPLLISFALVEEKIILSLLLKLLFEDASLLNECVEECLDPLTNLLSKGEKSYLKDYSNSIFSIMINNSEE